MEKEQFSQITGIDSVIPEAIQKTQDIEGKGYKFSSYHTENLIDTRISRGPSSEMLEKLKGTEYKVLTFENESGAKRYCILNEKNELVNSALSKLRYFDSQYRSTAEYFLRAEKVTELFNEKGCDITAEHTMALMDLPETDNLEEYVNSIYDEISVNIDYLQYAQATSGIESFGHELLACGKDRQARAVNMLYSSALDQYYADDQRTATDGMVAIGRGILKNRIKEGQPVNFEQAAAFGYVNEAFKALCDKIKENPDQANRLIRDYTSRMVKSGDNRFTYTKNLNQDIIQAISQAITNREIINPNRVSYDLARLSSAIKKRAEQGNIEASKTNKAIKNILYDYVCNTTRTGLAYSEIMHFVRNTNEHNISEFIDGTSKKNGSLKDYELSIFMLGDEVRNDLSPEYIKQTPESCLDAIQKDGLALKYVKKQTPELCMAAIKHRVDAFYHVKEQTPELCMAAVQQGGYMLKHVKEQTPEICLAAVQNYGSALQYVEEKTHEICLAAVMRSGHALEYVEEQTPELCMAAVKQDGYALRYVREKTPELCMEAVKSNGHALEYVEEQTPELCMAAVQHNGYALQYVKNQTPELCMAAVQQAGDALSYVKDQTPELCATAVLKDKNALRHVNEKTLEIRSIANIHEDGLNLVDIENQTPEICLAAVQQNGQALRYVKDQTPEICLAAVQQDGNVLSYVDEQTSEICKAAIQQNPTVIYRVRGKEMFEEMLNSAEKSNTDLLDTEIPDITETDIYAAPETKAAPEISDTPSEEHAQTAENDTQSRETQEIDEQGDDTCL